ncbi:uncharacterized protein EMH_0026800 [Eimeria mitis]|uniref:CS domain-containing protein n=1 Tax=Eimeria mitis TaxID=44415 RepID=U6JXI9_9EIME|nr:uncharacterized protein EMH_0026800 [Eimeria mitis]CDJ30200.1 hypothetical protein, conserved [Eimeria mitis]
MEYSLCNEDKCWRATRGKRTEELLRQPQAALFGTPQPRDVEWDGTKGTAAGLQTVWEEEKDKGWHRIRRHRASSQVAARLSGRLEEASGSPNARRLELFQRRNSSSKLQDLINWTSNGSEESEILHNHGLHGSSAGGEKFRTSHSLKRQIAPPGEQKFGEILEHRFVKANPSDPVGNNRHSGGKASLCVNRDQHDIRGIISHSYMVSDPVVPSHRRISHVHAAENPCRWGVDVLNYQLPEPRKLRGTGTEENLEAGLIPRQSFDEISCVERRMKSTKHRSYTRGHLEPSTLYPAESDSLKFAQGKRRSKVEGDNLDNGMVPCVGPESCRKRCSNQWHMRSIQIDLTPQNSAIEKTGRRQHPGWQRELAICNLQEQTSLDLTGQEYYGDAKKLAPGVANATGRTLTPLGRSPTHPSGERPGLSVASNDTQRFDILLYSTVTHISLVLRIPSLKADLRQRHRDRQLSVIVASCYLRVCWHPWLLEVDFWGDVAFRSATVIPGVDCLTITVPKVEEGLWGSLTAVGNAQLHQDIRERRRIALAEYAEWQDQVQKQRIAARDARKQQQQKHIWRQQQEQREWCKRQKDIQVQQVLQQLHDDTGQPVEFEKTQEKPPRPIADREAWEHKLKCICEPETTTDASSTHEGRQQLQAFVDPCPAAGLSEDSCNIGTLGEKQNTVVNYDDEASTSEGKEGPQARTVAPTTASQGGARMKETSDSPVSKSLVASADKGLTGASNDSQPAQLGIQSVKLLPSTKIKVSFAARRPNKAPARGPLVPPLPQSEPDIGRQICTREKSKDLSRLQESSPPWLHSKATRLLIGGDAAAADETYSLILQPTQRETLHRMFYIKALCGRSLARLASGHTKKALSDCNEAMTLLQELQQQDDEAAAVAGHPVEKGPLQAELLRLQHILLARRSTAFLRLDALDELQQVRKVKEEADTVLRLALTTHHGVGSAHPPSSMPREIQHSHEEKQKTQVCGTTEHAPKTQCLLQRSIEAYVNCLAIIVPQPVEGSKRPGNATTQEVTESAAWRNVQTEEAARVTAVAAQFQAAVQASAANNASFPWAVVAAAVIANMTQAVTELQENSSVSAARLALSTAETLIQHAEERLRLQQIETLPSLSTAEETEERARYRRHHPGGCTTESSHCASTHLATGRLGILHQVRMTALCIS